MFLHPFSIFEPFSDRLRIQLCTKEDGIFNDAMASAVLGTDTYASAEQVHGRMTEVVKGPAKRVAGADGLLTNKRKLTVMVRVADCQSFVLYDPINNAAGVLHAGWRGVVAGAIPQCIEMMQKEWGSNPADILVGAGPSLCQTCAEFTDPEKELPTIDRRFFYGRNVDLRGCADEQLQKAGITKNHIERSPDCTKCQSDLYWSYRGGDREAVLAGYENVLACMLR